MERYFRLTVICLWQSALYEPHKKQRLVATVLCISLSLLDLVQVTWLLHPGI